MNPSSRERDVRLKEIFEKRNITRFWVGYQMLTEEVGCSDLTAFEDCLIYFTEERMFEGMFHGKLQVEVGCLRVYLRATYKMEETHPMLKSMIDFCKERKIDWSGIGGASDTFTVLINDYIVKEYVKSVYKKHFGCEIEEFTSHAEGQFTAPVGIDRGGLMAEEDDGDALGGVDDEGPIWGCNAPISYEEAQRAQISYEREREVQRIREAQRQAEMQSRRMVENSSRVDSSMERHMSRIRGLMSK